MIVPTVGSRSLRLDHLANSVANCATFRQLVGAADIPTALNSIYKRLALDDGSMPFPRCIVRPYGPQANKGTFSWIGSGEMSVFIQYEMLTDAELLAWYELTGGVPTLLDHQQHAENLFGQISDELQTLASSQAAGCLEFHRLEEFSCGTVDPVTENGVRLVEMVYQVHRDGLP